MKIPVRPLFKAMMSSRRRLTGSHPGLLLLGAAFPALLHAQDLARQTPSAARIERSLEVPDFVPPPLPVVKRVPAMRVDAAITVPSGNSKKITVIRGEASVLPAIPEPPVAAVEVQRNITPEEREEFRMRMAWQQRHQVNLGATIYDQRVSIASWRDAGSGEFHQAICGFDLGLLEGIGEFTSNGESYSLYLMATAVDSTKNRRLAGESFPDPSKIEPGSITPVQGSSEDPAGLASLAALRDLIVAEKERLIIHRAALQRRREEAAAWEQAHPQVAHDEVFWLKPHRGSRYLADPTPQIPSR